MEQARITPLRIIWLLLTPSIGSIMLSLVVGTAVATLTIITILNHDALLSSFHLNAFDTNAAQLQEVSQIVNNSETLAKVSVFFAWFIAGVLGYGLVEMVWHWLRSGYTFEKELEYANQPTTRLHIFRQGLIHLGTRALGLMALLTIYQLIVIVLPRIILAVNKVDALTSWRALSVVVIAALAAMLIMHLVIIALRALLYRLRILSQYGWLDIVSD